MDQNNQQPPTDQPQTPPAQPAAEQAQPAEPAPQEAPATPPPAQETQAVPEAALSPETPASAQPETTAPTQPAALQAPEPKHKSPLLLIGGITVIIVAIVGVLAYVFMMNQATPQPTTPEPRQTQVITPSPIPSPTVAPVQGTVDEVNQVDIGDDTDDISNLQNDASQL